MGSERELRKLLSSATLVFAGAGVAAIAKLLERIALGRSFSPDIYGEINIAITMMALGTTFALIGLGQGIPRYVSRFDTERDRRGAWLTGFLLAGTVSILFAGLLYFNADFVAAKLFDHDGANQLIPMFAFAIPPVVGFFVGVGGIRGFENTIYKTYVGDLLYPFGRLLLWARFYCWDSERRQPVMHICSVPSSRVLPPTTFSIDSFLSSASSPFMLKKSRRFPHPLSFHLSSVTSSPEQIPSCSATLPPPTK